MCGFFYILIQPKIFSTIIPSFPGLALSKPLSVHF